MENTTNYSIDTNSTTCHSQMETPVQLIGTSKSNSSSNSNSVGQLDTKVPLSKQPSIQDKFLFTQQNQQSQQSQQQYQIEQQQRSHQQKDLIANYTSKSVNKPFTIETEQSLIPRQHPVPHGPHGEQPNYSSNTTTKPTSRMETFKYDPFPTDFQYPSVTPQLQQRMSPGMQKRWSRSGSNHTNRGKYLKQKKIKLIRRLIFSQENWFILWFLLFVFDKFTK